MWCPVLRPLNRSVNPNQRRAGPDCFAPVGVVRAACLIACSPRAALRASLFFFFLTRRDRYPACRAANGLGRRLYSAPRQSSRAEPPLMAAAPARLRGALAESLSESQRVIVPRARLLLCAPAIFLPHGAVRELARPMPSLYFRRPCLVGFFRVLSWPAHFNPSSITLDRQGWCRKPGARWWSCAGTRGASFGTSSFPPPWPWVLDRCLWMARCAENLPLGPSAPL